MPRYFVHGAMILTLAGLISKFLGALYRIPLARLLDGEGMGLYQMAYPVYTILLALSTAGLPVAISILVAEYRARGDGDGAYRVFRVALLLLIISGSAGSFALYKGARLLAVFLHEPRAFLPLVALSPAILMVAVMSAFRGYFQGRQEMNPTALSQVIEQVVRVITVLIAAWFLLPRGIEFAAAGATFGAVAGSAAGLVVLLVIYTGARGDKRNWRAATRRRRGASFWQLTFRIAGIALPLSLGGLVFPVMQIIDATMVPLRLQAAGYSQSQATYLFGMLTGMAGTLINLPTIITAALAASLVPAVAGAQATRHQGAAFSIIGDGLRITAWLALPAAAGLLVLAEPVGLLLYDLDRVGEPLMVLAPSVLFLGMYQVTGGALQGLGSPSLPVRHLLAGALVKVAFNYFLTAIPSLGIQGAAFGTVAGFFVAFGLNFHSLYKYGFRLAWMDSLLKPAFAATIMALIVNKSYIWLTYILGHRGGAAVAILAGMALYFLVLCFSGAVRERDLMVLPGAGSLLVKQLRKIGIVRR